MAAGNWGHVFLEHVARNINPFLWEMLCKDVSASCERLGNIVLMETECKNDWVSEQLLFLPYICDLPSLPSEGSGQYMHH